MEEIIEPTQKSTVKFSRKFLKIALFPLSLAFTFFFTQQYFTKQINELRTAESELKNQLSLQLVFAQKLDIELNRVEKQIDSFDTTHSSLFNAIVDIEDLLQGEAFKPDFVEKPKLQGASVFGEIELRTSYLAKKLMKQQKFLQTFLAVARDKESMMESIPAVCPIYFSDLKRVSSGFGMRKDPIDSTMKMHKGIDISAEIGTKVYAAGSGKIIRIASSEDGYGNCIVIDHGFGFVSRYAHLSGFKVKEGDEVKKGDLIGMVGSSGRSTGPHLHYEIEKEGEKIDPKKYIKIDLKGVDTY
jgi:murein DD-endopeptidase MepM/ murein hydrolase activator NlpD